MVARARPLETDIGCTLSRDPAAVEQPDLVFASGRIQHAPDALALVRCLLQTGAPRIVFSRWPLSDGPTPLMPPYLTLLPERQWRRTAAARGQGCVGQSQCLEPAAPGRRTRVCTGAVRRAGVVHDLSGTIGPHEGRAYILERHR